MIFVLKRLEKKTSAAHDRDVIGQSGSYQRLWAASCWLWPVTTHLSLLAEQHEDTTVRLCHFWGLF